MLQCYLQYPISLVPSILTVCCSISNKTNPNSEQISVSLQTSMVSIMDIIVITTILSKYCMVINFSLSLLPFSLDQIDSLRYCYDERPLWVRQLPHILPHPFRGWSLSQSSCYYTSSMEISQIQGKRNVQLFFSFKTSIFIEKKYLLQTNY